MLLFLRQAARDWLRRGGRDGGERPGRGGQGCRRRRGRAEGGVVPRPGPGVPGAGQPRHRAVPGTAAGPGSPGHGGSCGLAGGEGRVGGTGLELAACRGWPATDAGRRLQAPLNPSDINMVEGTYPIKQELPATPGNEGVGVVAAVGPEVRPLEHADRAHRSSAPARLPCQNPYLLHLSHWSAVFHVCRSDSNLAFAILAARRAWSWRFIVVLLQVIGLAVGDKVVPLHSGLGTWCQRGVYNSKCLHLIPPDLPLHASAMLCIKCGMP